MNQRIIAQGAVEIVLGVAYRPDRSEPVGPKGWSFDRGLPPGRFDFKVTAAVDGDTVRVTYLDPGHPDDEHRVFVPPIPRRLL